MQRLIVSGHRQLGRIDFAPRRHRSIGDALLDPESIERVQARHGGE
ncbi:MAG: hypothetical protein U1E76_14440 [Planctomycetota bacterium]